MDITDFKHNVNLEKIVGKISKQSRIKDLNFLRLLVINAFNKIASTMRAYIHSEIYGDIPINSYIIALANSGFGKNLTMNSIESLVISKFKKEFIEKTLPVISEKNIEKTAKLHAEKYDVDYDEEIARLITEFNTSGHYLMSFDSATTAGAKQMRGKLLIAGIGSLNLEIDEIGNNLTGSSEILTLFLELFDKGLTKPKLLKNTKENVRNKDIDGSTPANVILFGTPIKLLDGSKIEDDFFEWLDTGYARRCFFGYGNIPRNIEEESAESIYEDLLQNNWLESIEEISEEFKDFASTSNYKKKFVLGKKESIFLIEYQLFCKKRAENLKEFEATKKTELLHRFFKVLKLAGTFAFIDDKNNNVVSLVDNKPNFISIENLQSAILIAESSGEAINKILHREQLYVKLGKFLLQSNGETHTHADLTSKLPFYKGQSRKDLLELAQAWGLKNNLIVKKHITNNIEFITGELLYSTDLSNLIISGSRGISEGYSNKEISFDQLTELVKLPDLNWVNHHFKDGHRCEKSIIKGFNLLALDIDSFEKGDEKESNTKNNVRIDFVKDFFKDYTYIIHTTKRHTEEFHRFRVIIPINYKLSLSKEDYDDFIAMIRESLPFNIDSQTKDRCRKWLTNPNAEIHVNEGKLFDVTNFIPNTDKAIVTKERYSKYPDIAPFERWVLDQSNDIGRNNALLRYGTALFDRGFSLVDISEKIFTLNNLLSSPLSVDEIERTIMVTIFKKFKENNIE